MLPVCCEERRNRILADKIVGNWAYLSLRSPHATFVGAELVSFWDAPDDAERSAFRSIETRITFGAADRRRWQSGIRAPWPGWDIAHWQVLD